MNFRVILVTLSLILSVLIGTVLSRTGSAVNSSGSKGIAGKGREPVIGLSLDTLKEERWQHDRDYFVSRAKELGAKVRVLSANGNDTQQVADVESLITGGIDILVIVPHNGAAMAKAVDKAHEAGIPVIAYDRLITGCDLDLYITFDNVKVGRMQAQYIIDQFAAEKKAKGRIVRLLGSKADNNAFLFKQGQDEILQPLIAAGKADIIHEDWCTDWSSAEAKKVVNAAIVKNGTAFDAILASADCLSDGAVQTLIEEHKAGEIIVTGQDAALTACQRIVNGTQTMTIYKPLKLLASRAAEIAYTMATKRVVVAPFELDNGKMKVPSLFMDIIVVDKNNMRETVIKDGFLTEEQIYGKK